MSKVSAASGSKYSAHNEPARKFEPIAPVGTNYTPVGKVDIASLKKAPVAPKSTVPAPTYKPSTPTSTRPTPTFGAPLQSSGLKTTIGVKAPADAWPEAPSPAIPTTPRPVPAVGLFSYASLYVTVTDVVIGARWHRILDPLLLSHPKCLQSPLKKIVSPPSYVLPHSVSLSHTDIPPITN